MTLTRLWLLVFIENHGVAQRMRLNLGLEPKPHLRKGACQLGVYQLTNEVLPNKELSDNSALRDVVDAWSKTSQMHVDCCDFDGRVCHWRRLGQVRVQGCPPNLPWQDCDSGGSDDEVGQLRGRSQDDTEARTAPRTRAVFWAVQRQRRRPLGSLSDTFERLVGQMTYAHKLVIMQQSSQGRERDSTSTRSHSDEGTPRCATDRIACKSTCRKVTFLHQKGASTDVRTPHDTTKKGAML